MPNTYKEACKKHIIDTIGNWEGSEVYLSDLGHMLTEGENANGSYYCSTYKAQEDLKAWFDDVAEFIENYKLNFGERPQWDAFTQPELFHCLMMIEGVREMFDSLEVVYSSDDDMITIDQAFIDAVIEEVENL